MTFCIKRTKLTPECREEIKSLFKTKKLEKVDVDGMLDEIDNWLPTFAHFHGEHSREPANTERIKKDLFDLRHALRKVHPDTLKLLNWYYFTSYPLPQPSDVKDSDMASVTFPDDPKNVKLVDPRVINQTGKTHIMTTGGQGGRGRSVTIEEFISRIENALKQIEENWRPDKGRKPDPRKPFVFSMASSYQRWTGESPSSTPSSTFNTLLACILEDIAGKDSNVCRRKLIESALSPRWQDPDYDAEG